MVNYKLIEELRINHGYTQGQLATMMGYSNRTTYNSKIKSARPFTVEDIVKLCTIFQLEPNDLITIMD